ncbi:MAG: ABC transporter permease [Sphingobacteriales bacterium]|nr:MAG: ABC transporter permease [Sphingobacteriales bacterium]
MLQSESIAAQDNWSEVIEPKTSSLHIPAKAVWNYRDLLMLLVRRDFVATYKQTVLGPVWFFLQPVLTTLTFTFIFGRVAGLSTDGMPMMLFYMAGITLWNYFGECLNRTATVLRDNASIFGKVYFPRLVMPLSIIISNLVKLGIQLVLFILFWLFYVVTGANIHPNGAILLLPFLIIIMGGLGLGLGMIISSMTTKYRDLVFLLTFGVQLLMYATPVIYPLSSIDAKYRWLIAANPMTPIIETFRYAFLGSGTFSILSLTYSAVFMIITLLAGIVIFNKVERSFMDTV